jgi:acetyl-CoA hydrolase/succinyl-CoA:acetate CoA-transferase
MVEFRIRYKPLIDKVTDPDTACKHIQDGTNVFVSGFTAGYPKLIPQALVRRVEAGERFKINLYAGASTGDAVDGILARRPDQLATPVHERPWNASHDQQ